ncbi:putative expansin-B2 [Corylus avellana]|uniref:putative expansin-B2 n=1 Tax=Corylus avellana TaxID=13451 RepID=UPI00286C4411|nr:putative expansin-B2 [Corylus avellana]
MLVVAAVNAKESSSYRYGQLVEDIKPALNFFPKCQMGMSSCLSLSCILAFFFFSKLCFCFNPKHLNLSTITTHWSSAGATWYGSPDGFGATGGACGYDNTVSQPAISSMVTGIGPSLYNSGKECGACYEVKCTKHRSCSGKPVRVVITDFCPGGPCASDSAHFDLSGTAFGAMAISSEENKVRDVGVLEIEYHKLKCSKLTLILVHMVHKVGIRSTKGKL